MTGILWHRHPERSRGTFTALRESACMRRDKTMYWCCLTSGDERSAIEISRLRPSDDGAKRYQNSAALFIFMRRTTIPHSCFLIKKPPRPFGQGGASARYHSCFSLRRPSCGCRKKKSPCPYGQGRHTRYHLALYFRLILNADQRFAY